MFANGITHNKDRSLFYIGDTFEKTIYIFKRNITTNALNIVHIQDVGHGVDNLKFDIEDNKVYAGVLHSVYHQMQVVDKYPDTSPKNFGGVTTMSEYKDKDGITRWKTEDVIVTNKINGPSNGIRI